MELKSSEISSVIYHNIFDYPLKREELKIWSCRQEIKIKKEIENKDGYFFVKGKYKLIKKRKQNENYSKVKFEIAEKASKIISKIPTVKFVGITGSLAMMNAGKDSDIDLIIITKINTLWTTRLFVYFLLWIFDFEVRRPSDKNEKNKLCLNMWLDENALVWDKNNRNLYTAHEILQIVPLINKEEIYKLFLSRNKWTLDYWSKLNKTEFFSSSLKTKRNELNLIETLVYKFQYLYMSTKKTNELISSNKAIFHPKDWSGVVLNRLNKIK